MEKKQTREQVLEAMGLNSFRDLTPKKMVDFLHKAKNMSEEERKDVISEIPNFTKLMEGTLDLLKTMGEKTLAGNEASMKRFYDHCDLIQHTLSDALKTATDTNEKMMIMDKMIEVANMVNNKDAENKQFLGKIALCGVVAVAIVCIGVKVAILRS